MTYVYLNKWYISHGLVGIVPEPRYGTCQKGTLVKRRASNMRLVREMWLFSMLLLGH